MHIYAHIDEPWFLWDTLLKIGTTWMEEYAYAYVRGRWLLPAARQGRVGVKEPSNHLRLC